MTIRIFEDRIKFVADSDFDADIDLIIESDGLRFTAPFTVASNVPYTNPPQIQILSFGFASGGPGVTTIDKFPFAISGGTATDVGDITLAKQLGASNTSSNDGFNSGGNGGPTSRTTIIDKFPFAISGGTGTDVGDLTEEKYGTSGQSSKIFGFVAGGDTSASPPNVDTLDKFPFTISSGTATDVANLRTALANTIGNSSSSDGYVSGGSVAAANETIISKFPFSIGGFGASTTNVGNLSQGLKYSAGISSKTDGFAAGGFGYPSALGSLTIIEKFPFAISGGTGTDVGDLSLRRYMSAPHSSNTDGFASGGTVAPDTSVIDKFPYSIFSGTATDVGDLSELKKGKSGHEN